MHNIYLFYTFSFLYGGFYFIFFASVSVFSGIEDKGFKILEVETSGNFAGLYSYAQGPEIPVIAVFKEGDCIWEYPQNVSDLCR